MLDAQQIAFELKSIVTTYLLNFSLSAVADFNYSPAFLTVIGFDPRGQKHKCFDPYKESS